MKGDKMVKHYIIRNKLYNEEERLENGISQQVCIDLSHYSKPLNLYATHREGRFLVQDELLHENTKIREHSKLIIYVLDEELALMLANRWINEPSQKEKAYEIAGVDKYYSIFN